MFRVGLRYFETLDPEGWELGVAGYRRHEERLWASMEPIIADTKPDVAIMHFVRPFGEAFLRRLSDRGIPVTALLHDAWAICQRYQLIQSPQGRPCSGPSVGKCAMCVYTNCERPPAVSMLRAPFRFIRRGPLRFKRLLARRAAGRDLKSFVAYSDHMFRTFRRVYPDKTVKIPLGIDLEGLPSHRPPRPHAPFRFGFVGGFQPHKGVWDVLRAAKSLAQERRVFQVHVWGPGQEGRRGEVEAEGLAGVVQLRGVYPLEERWNVFAEMDLLLMATTQVEPFGRVVGEAAASGVPTIAPAIGGITEQIRDGVDGFLFPFKSSAGLAERMARAMEPTTYTGLVEALASVLDTRQAIVLLESHLDGLRSDSNPFAKVPRT